MGGIERGILRGRGRGGWDGRQYGALRDMRRAQRGPQERSADDGYGREHQPHCRSTPGSA